MYKREKMTNLFFIILFLFMPGFSQSGIKPTPQQLAWHEREIIL